MCASRASASTSSGWAYSRSIRSRTRRSRSRSRRRSAARGLLLTTGSWHTENRRFSCGHPRSGDDAHLAAGVVEPPSAVLGGDDDVLDAHAEAAGEVDAGLDREAHPGLDRVLLPLDHVGRLVRGHPDPVPDAMDEAVAVAGVGDHPARGAVDLLAGHAGAHRLVARLLRAPHHLEDLALLRGRLADVDRARRVGAVAVLEPAEVEHDHVTRLDPPVARLVMRVGAVRARADDGEVDLAVAVLEEQRREIGGDLGLEPPG